MEAHQHGDQELDNFLIEAKFFVGNMNPEFGRRIRASRDDFR
jgi:hypothetical protein